MLRAHVNGIELEYEIRGDGEPIILLHGGLLADENAPLLNESTLTSRYRVINYHRRGFVGSSRPMGKATIQDQASDCRALMESLGIEKAHIVGHSLGGAIALQVALDYPNVVQSLALMEPALMAAIARAEQTADAVESQRQFMAGMERVNQIFATGDRKAALEAFLETRAGGAFRGVLEFLLKTGEFHRAVQDADTFLQVEMPAAYRWEFTPAQAARIKQPVLSMLGAHSPERARKVEQVMATWIPQTEKLVLSDAEHALPLMDPPGIAAAVAGWCARHPMC